MSKHYTTKEIREFIKCPQFGDTEYGKWGSLKLEVREALLEQVNLIESMDYIIQQKENIIKEVREYIDNKKSYTTIKKPTDKYVDGKVIFEEVDEDILYESMINELLEILDKGE